MLFANPFKDRLPTAAEALPSRPAPIVQPGPHAVLGSPMAPPFAEGAQQILLGMGCFWGAERLFWQLPGMLVTAVGYAGGITENPTYEEVCSGRTGHTEVVLAVYDPARLALDDILQLFWQEHDPTQGYRQGNDRGTQYRSALYCSDDTQLAEAEASARQYGAALAKAGYDSITTEITGPRRFFYAEEYHQQYLHKVPNGYCGLAGCGVAYR